MKHEVEHRSVTASGQPRSPPRLGDLQPFLESPPLLRVNSLVFTAWQDLRCLIFAFCRSFSLSLIEISVSRNSVYHYVHAPRTASLLPLHCASIGRPASLGSTGPAHSTQLWYRYRQFDITVCLQQSFWAPHTVVKYRARNR